MKKLILFVISIILFVSCKPVTKSVVVERKDGKNDTIENVVCTSILTFSKPSTVIFKTDNGTTTTKRYYLYTEIKSYYEIE